MLIFFTPLKTQSSSATYLVFQVLSIGIQPHGIRCSFDIQHHYVKALPALLSTGIRPHVIPCSFDMQSHYVEVQPAQRNTGIQPHAILSSFDIQNHFVEVQLKLRLLHSLLLALPSQHG